METNKLSATQVQVLESVLGRKETRSRSEIANLTGLSMASVSNIVGDLIDGGVLLESGVRESLRGRPRIQLKINPRLGVILIFHVSHSRVQVIHLDMGMEVMSQFTIADQPLDGDDLHRIVLRHVKEMEEKQHVLGIGVSVEDDVQQSELSVMFSTSLSSSPIGIGNLLETELGIPVLIQKISDIPTCIDTNLMLNLHKNEYSDFAVVDQPSNLAQVVLNDRPVAIGGDKRIDVSMLVDSQGPVFNQIPKQDESHLTEENRALVLLFAIAGIFPVRAIVLRSWLCKTENKRAWFAQAWNRVLPKNQNVRLIPLDQSDSNSRLMTQGLMLRNRVLIGE